MQAIDQHNKNEPPTIDSGEWKMNHESNFQFSALNFQLSIIIGCHVMKGALEKLTVKGFKSIKDLNEFKLGDLNIIIGSNGAGKSNFVQVFRMLMAMTQKNLSRFILERGGADNFLFEGPKSTS